MGAPGGDNALWREGDERASALGCAPHAPKETQTRGQTATCGWPSPPATLTFTETLQSERAQVRNVAPTRMAEFREIFGKQVGEQLPSSCSQENAWRDPGGLGASSAGPRRVPGELRVRKLHKRLEDCHRCGTCANPRAKPEVLRGRRTCPESSGTLPATGIRGSSLQVRGPPRRATAVAAALLARPSGMAHSDGAGLDARQAHGVAPMPQPSGSPERSEWRDHFAEGLDRCRGGPELPTLSSPRPTWAKAAARQPRAGSGRLRTRPPSPSMRGALVTRPLVCGTVLGSNGTGGAPRLDSSLGRVWSAAAKATTLCMAGPLGGAAAETPRGAGSAGGCSQDAVRRVCNMRSRFSCGPGGRTPHASGYGRAR